MKWLEALRLGTELLLRLGWVGAGQPLLLNWTFHAKGKRWRLRGTLIQEP